MTQDIPHFYITIFLSAIFYNPMIFFSSYIMNITFGVSVNSVHYLTTYASEFQKLIPMVSGKKISFFEF